MDKKRIEEIAKILHDGCLIAQENNDCHGIDCLDCAAKIFYDVVYRKQSEWISVEERLPKRMEPVLVCIKGYMKKPIMVVSEMLEENGTRWSACAGFTVTNWMPLPEPPKMKGGAE